MKYDDPLHCRTVPIQWAKSLQQWNNKIKDLTKCQKKVLILQGTSDTIVSWKYNTKLLQKKFPNSEVKLIEKGRHELFNEAELMRQNVFDMIGDHFSVTSNQFNVAQAARL